MSKVAKQAQSKWVKDGVRVWYIQNLVDLRTRRQDLVRGAGDIGKTLRQAIAHMRSKGYCDHTIWNAAESDWTAGVGCGEGTYARALAYGLARPPEDLWQHLLDPDVVQIIQDQNVELLDHAGVRVLIRNGITTDRLPEELTHATYTTLRMWAQGRPLSWESHMEKLGVARLRQIATETPTTDPERIRTFLNRTKSLEDSIDAFVATTDIPDCKYNKEFKQKATAYLKESLEAFTTKLIS